MGEVFCIYKLLKRSVQYTGVEVLVPSSWQLMREQVDTKPNSAALLELVKANPHSSYIMVRVETASNHPDAAPETLGLEEGLKLAVATEAFLD